MSEKVKSNTYKMVDPGHLGFNIKRTDLLDMRKYVYGGHLKKWPPMPFRAKFDMALYVPNFTLVS